MQINKKLDPLCFVYFAFAMLQHLFTLDYSNECKKEKKKKKKLVHPYIFNFTHKNGVIGKKSRIICHVSCTSHYTQPRTHSTVWHMTHFFD